MPLAQVPWHGKDLLCGQDVLSCCVRDNQTASDGSWLKGCTCEESTFTGMSHVPDSRNAGAVAPVAVLYWHKFSPSWYDRLAMQRHMSREQKSALILEALSCYHTNYTGYTPAK